MEHSWHGRIVRVSRQGDGTEDHEHPGQERSPNDVAEPMEAKIQPAKGNDHHTSNHQDRRQGLHNTAPSHRDARSADSEQRADHGHVPGRKERYVYVFARSMKFGCRNR